MGFGISRISERGMAFVNRPTKLEADLLFGGISGSGRGRELQGWGSSSSSIINSSTTSISTRTS
jgi:hypothetical protein